MNGIRMLCLGIALGLASSGSVAEELSGSTATRAGVQLADVNLGEHWSGPQVDLDALKGKVVLFVIWGS